MISKDDVLVVKSLSEVVISFNGAKLVKPIEGFENKSEQEIIEWFLKEVNSS